ncbi:MAG: hypothetical protein HY983_00210 [Candidatus Magasanikbacteria bacterium]|nr:hypothetical protein [Candidatus Magasanikbacteria bacterium]
MKKILSFLIFAVVGILLSQVPFTYLVGANARFTMFDFFGPIVGSFLGTLPGAITVLLVQIVNWAIHGFSSQPAAIIRFFPVVAATLYFARPSKWLLAIPGVAIIAFLIHPEGRQATVFALYWLIPFAMHRLSHRFVFAKALAATFIAHSVGGALWIWVLNMKAALWMSLLPVVWKERGLMALGITLSYLALGKLLQISIVKGWVPQNLFGPRSSVNVK